MSDNFNDNNSELEPQNETTLQIINHDNSVDLNAILDGLKSIYDPEITDFSIYDLGLIYKIEIKDSHAHITMTLTSMSCPEAQSIPEDAKNMVQSLCPDANITVEVVFEPTWTVDLMSDEVKLKLNLL